MTNDEFVDVFKQIGQLKSCKIIRDKSTGNSFGFGFAEYFEPIHATQAVNELNGLQIKDKQIKVAYAKALSQIKSGNLYVRFLPPEFSDKEIRQLFEPFGTISTCRILKNDQGMSRGVAFVLYDREESAKLAMENLDDTMLGDSDQRISVKFADDAKQKHKFNSQKTSRGGGGGGGGMGGGGGNNSMGGMMNGQQNSMQQSNMAMQQQQIQLQNQMLMQQQALFQQLQQQLAAQMSGQTPAIQNQFNQGMSSTGPIRNSRNNNRYNPMGGDASSGNLGDSVDMQGGNGPLSIESTGQMQNQLGQMNNMAQLISSLMGNNQMSSMNNQGNMQSLILQNNPNAEFAQFERTAKNKDGYTLFVYNTGPECTEDQLRTLFSQYGALNKVALMKDDNGKSRGFAFVSLPSFDNACSAINGLNGYLLINGTYSNKLQVSFKVKK